MSSDPTPDPPVSIENTPLLLTSWRLRDLDRGRRNLDHLAAALGPDGLRQLGTPLGRLLPRTPDPDMALNNLERFLGNSAGARTLPSLLEHRGRALETLLQLLGTSQFFSDLLALNPDYLDMLRVPLRRSPSQAEMRDQLQAEVDAAFEDSAVLRAFRRFRQRQTLRIGTNDVIRDRPLEEITRDISRVADAAIEVALTTALRTVARRFGQPFTDAGQPARCCVLAFGKLGGEELNYSSDIDLMFLYDEEGTTRGQHVAGVGNDDYFGRVVGEIVRLLSAHTDRGQAYRVDLRLRPEGGRGPLARSLDSTLGYYDALGRTWERQALIKVRPVAGDLELGRSFLHSVEPFVYRKYLSFAEINEIKALKRQIEQKTSRAGVSDREVKTGRGGIRDIEFTIQFLQLLNCGDLAEVRQRNTLLSLQALEGAGCVTDQEYRVLDDAYRFLRRTEHRLQLLFDLQTHQLPEAEDELRRLALRMGYPRRGPRNLGRKAVTPDPAATFLRDYREKTEPTRRILDHLLHQTFAGSAGEAEPESDLILDPNPDPDTVRTVLEKYQFRDVQGAYLNLAQLAQESVPFLSTRRCRHFLASIAPALLRAVADTPDPDMALVNLEKVTATLGAKAVLWELFSFNPPSLKLYVDLCAWSQFLSEILINNPGMIDELLDTLVLNQPRTAAELQAELADLCRGATDLEPILHSFQDKELLRIGVRDILGKAPIRETTAALSDLAETILQQIAALQTAALEKRLGIPTLTEGERAGRRCRFALLGLGKLGAREMNYHSDLDLVAIYEGDGRTAPPAGLTRFDAFTPTDNLSFYTELAQRIIRAMSVLGPMGRLYQVDMRLRPTGRSGSLVLPLAEFRHYFAVPGGATPLTLPSPPGGGERGWDPGGGATPLTLPSPPGGGGRGQGEGGGAQVWERQALTRARVVHGNADFDKEVMAVVAEGAFRLPWRSEFADEVLSMRQRLEGSRAERDLKRGFGGVVDVEFLVQLFQLKYGRVCPALRTSNTWDALDALQAAGVLDGDDHAALRAGYDFLLRVQSRLRIVHNRSLDAVPGDAHEVEKLARRLGYESGTRFLAEVERHTAYTRGRFLRLVDRERGP
jgi:glutamate-ammonia-ligase adenylyltransferase